MDLKDSKTKINLLKAFAGESQARNRYDMAAEAAKKEGYIILQNLFKYTADQERAHAQAFYSQLSQFDGESIAIGKSGYSIETSASTLQLLKYAVHDETQEAGDIYPKFASVAEKEGFPAIAALFRNVASIEAVHAKRFEKYAEMLENGTLFKQQKDSLWMCTNCGFIYEGAVPPKKCPVCQHPQGYQQLFITTPYE